MAWLGICYEGEEANFLPRVVEENHEWLKNDRIPRVYGSHFVLIYDSNTAREFLKKIKSQLKTGKITVYTVPSVLTEYQM